MEPPPQDHPLAQWFYNKEDFDLYHSDFASRKVIPPRYLEPNFFYQHHYPNFELSANWNLNYDGKEVDSGNASAEFRRIYSKENACITFNVPIGTPKPTVGLLSIEHRLLHYFLTYVLIPRSGNHGLILDEDLEIMWRMECPRSSSTRTRDPQQEEEAQPQEPQGQPSEQPSMHDMMQALLRIEQNQADMGNKLHRIERNQARMLRKIRRVEAYTFSEDEAEDDDDDLDWL
ncbi:hypothetical protein PIB30_105749 [Stylosanthes scabra]|uniref:Uncharacterized protein n=1 Tax=Stylosanthes scabra TaxID=79078 RepID=A0ABU6SYY0_9FABA|nr:hypothetical protein [Stylosanthes scabra]